VAATLDAVLADPSTAAEADRTADEADVAVRMAATHTAAAERRLAEARQTLVDLEGLVDEARRAVDAAAGDVGRQATAEQEASDRAGRHRKEAEAARHRVGHPRHR
jgi:hypothetical protein